MNKTIRTSATIFNSSTVGYMDKYFDIQLEFDHAAFEKTVINTSLKGKGYCCFIDSNLLVDAHTTRKNDLRDVLNNSLANSCDGSYIAKLASLVYKRKLVPYNGPEFFTKFIYHRVNQCIVGNTSTVFEKIKNKVEQKNGTSSLHYISLPFAEVNQFDYPAIAEKINSLKPRYIWVSLGAPKQEIFVSNLLPYLNSGVMLAVGAALNYFSGEIKDIPGWATKYNLIWFFRIMTEPKKQLKRVIKIVRYYPKLYFLGKRDYSFQLSINNQYK